MALSLSRVQFVIKVMENMDEFKGYESAIGSILNVALWANVKDIIY